MWKASLRLLAIDKKSFEETSLLCSFVLTLLIMSLFYLVSIGNWHKILHSHWLMTFNASLSLVDLVRVLRIPGETLSSFVLLLLCDSFSNFCRININTLHQLGHSGTQCNRLRISLVTFKKTLLQIYQINVKRQKFGDLILEQGFLINGQEFFFFCFAWCDI